MGSVGAYQTYVINKQASVVYEKVKDCGVDEVTKRIKNQGHE